MLRNPTSSTFSAMRALRPRKSQPSYSAAFAFDDDEVDGQPVAGPSRRALVDEDDSESDFSPEKEASHVDPEEDELSADGSVMNESLDPDDDDDDLDLAGGSSVAAPTTKPRPAAKGPSKSRAKGPPKANKVVSEVVVMPSLGSGSGIARTSKRQIYILPTPSVHHRHKAVPLYSRTARVERLAAKPVLFGPSVTTATNNFTHSSDVTNRVNRGWGFNVGAGPLWDLIEDRGWYKEALVADGDVEIEANRRPVTHHGLRVKPGLQILSLKCETFWKYVLFVLTFHLFSEATPYLPTDSITTEEGNLKPPPPISCSFGPFDNQRRVDIGMFESRKNCWLHILLMRCPAHSL
jgi:transcription factor C subunit 6